MLIAAFLALSYKYGPPAAKRFDSWPKRHTMEEEAAAVIAEGEKSYAEIARESEARQAALEESIRQQKASDAKALAWLFAENVALSGSRDTRLTISFKLVNGGVGPADSAEVACALVDAAGKPLASMRKAVGRLEVKGSVAAKCLFDKIDLPKGVAVKPSVQPL